MIIAVDPGSRYTGVCAYDGDTYTTTLLSSISKDPAARCESLARSFDRLLTYHKPELILIERPHMSMQGYANEVVSGLLMLYRVLAYQKDIQVKLINPQSWKGVFGFNRRRCPKEQSVELAKTFCALTDDNDEELDISSDEADAACMLRAYILAPAQCTKTAKSKKIKVPFDTIN